MLSAQIYQNSRKKVAEQLRDNSIYFVHSGDPAESSHDETYMFEPYRNFLYLTGLDVKNATLLISKVNGTVSEVLFMHIPSEKEQRWDNVSFDREALQKSTGIDRIVANEEWEDVVSRLMFSGVIQDCYVDIARWRMSYAYNSEQILARKLQKAYPFLTMHNAYPIVCELRTIKYPEEIEAHRKAVAITEAGVRNMLHHMKPGMYEYEIEAYYDFVLKSNGVRTPAFWTIAAAGQNANHMHYMDNNTKTKDGDMILFDLGARWDYYCADVSRTYPVNGKFTNRQAQLYDVVLKGLKAAEDYSRPGEVKNDLQERSKQVMAEALVDIGKIKTPEEIDKYYFHGSGHFIGLDTHDVGDHDRIVLKKDMMFTLEPGLYFDDEEIGIRIEDTLLVTENGCDVFSGSIPKEIEDIEAVMAGKR